MNLALGLLLFAAMAAIGFRLMRAIPPLLHTPLMSGMNALSGIIVLAAVSAWLAAPSVPAGVAVALAMANVVGGFLVTHRMLSMFRRQRRDGEDGS